VSAHLLDRLLKEKKIDGSKCILLCLASVSQGPFVHLNGSYLLQPYFNYIENAAARELFVSLPSRDACGSSSATGVSKSGQPPKQAVPRELGVSVESVRSALRSQYC
jgi:hypothetical protein